MNNAIGTVERNLLEGALIVVLVLVLFLGNVRAGLLVASIMPLSMLFAIIMMNWFGVSGNPMSLGAGYLIDPSKNKDGQPAVVNGALYVQHVNVFADSMASPRNRLGGFYFYPFHCFSFIRVLVFDQ